MHYYLDANIIIYYMKATYPEVRDRLLSLKVSDIKVPAVVAAELSYGVAKSQAKAANAEIIKATLTPFAIVPFDIDAATVYGKLRVDLERAGTIIGPHDMLIAATVMSRGGILITHNTKEFSRISGLQYEDWVNA
jgi:tRNA(fMet)-specific endonuclease VapC